MVRVTFLVLALAVASGGGQWGRLRGRIRTPNRLGKRTTPQDEARFLRSVAGDMAVGVSAHRAFERAAVATPTIDIESALRRASAGAGFGVLGPVLAPSLPVSGELLSVALPVAAHSGAGLVAVLDRLADRADSVAAAHRERRVATAQARLSAAVIGGLPLAAAVLLAGSGSMAGLDPLGRRVVAIAVVLLGLGLTSMAWMVRR